MKNQYEIRGDYVAIFLKRRKGEPMETFIDIEDLPLADSIKGSWFAQYNPSVRGFYVAAHEHRTVPLENSGYLYMHRVLMGVPEGLTVDHQDRQPLNNRRDNLRSVTMGQNLQNRGMYKNNTSGVRGVTWNKEKQKWKARVNIKGKEVFTRYFTDIEEAAEAVRKARGTLMPYANEEA